MDLRFIRATTLGTSSKGDCLCFQVEDCTDTSDITGKGFDKSPIARGDGARGGAGMDRSDENVQYTQHVVAPGITHTSEHAQNDCEVQEYNNSGVRLL